MSGAIDMYMLLRPEKASCVKTWFYENGGTTQTYKIFDKFPDNPAVAIMQVLIERECGKEE